MAKETNLIIGPPGVTLDLQESRGKVHNHLKEGHVHAHVADLSLQDTGQSLAQGHALEATEVDQGEFMIGKCCGQEESC